MIPGPLHDVFNIVFESLQEMEHPWVLTGSLAFAYQGLPVTPNDIDIQTDRAGAYEIEQCLSDFIVRHVVFSESGSARSYFGGCQINGVKVEIIGDIEKLKSDGTWSKPPDLKTLRRFVRYDDIDIPVLPLEYESEAYRQMGRVDKAELLSKYI
ncbi:MAG: nucleotidyltransferase domain-containing protein [Tuberibacillus sp.]